jgi:phosphatidylinositol glycan class B
VIAKITLYINFAFLVISCLRPANPSVSFYKFVYDNPHIRNIIAVEEDPYLMLNLKNKFYRPENLEVSVVKTFADIQLENNIFVWFNKGHHILAMASEKNCTMIYSAYPKWSLNFNIGNWLSRSRFWSLYSCGVN